MSVDLFRAAERGGAMGFGIELLRSWFAARPPQVLADELDLLEWVRSPDVVERLPWPGDRLLPLRSQEPEVIGEECEGLWRAVLTKTAAGVPRVIFEVDGARSLDQSVGVAEFVCRVLVQSAVHSSDNQLRCKPREADAFASHTLMESLRIDCESGSCWVQFPPIVAGRGWLGELWAGGAHLATERLADELADELRHIGDHWEKLVEVDAPKDEGWSPWEGKFGPDSRSRTWRAL